MYQWPAELRLSRLWRTPPLTGWARPPMTASNVCMVSHSHQRKNLMTTLPWLRKRQRGITVSLVNNNTCLLITCSLLVAVSGTLTVLRSTINLLSLLETSTEWEGIMRLLPLICSILSFGRLQDIIRITRITFIYSKSNLKVLVWSQWTALAIA